MKENIRFPSFVSFISSPAGRGARIFLGLTMIISGYRARSKAGFAVAALGLAPLAAGSLDFCIIGPALGGYFQGPRMRRALHQQAGFPQLDAKPASFLRA